MKNSRVSYIDPDSAITFSYLVKSKLLEPQEDGLIKAELKEFKLISILKMLESISNGHTRFSELSKKSGIRYKSAFAEYKKMALHYGLIVRYVPNKFEVHYRLTDKGRDLLSMFRNI